MDALPIIFIHKGDSFYLKYALENAKKHNPKSRVILIGDNVTQKPSFVEYHEMSKYSSSALKFRKVYKHMSSNNEEIERFCFERWFILSEFLKKNKIRKCLTMDSDVLLFVDVTKDFKKFEKYAFTLANHLSGEFMYINDSKEIFKLAKFIFDLFTDKKLKPIFENFWKEYKKKGKPGGINDMLAFEEYYKRNSKKIGEISDIIGGETYDTMINKSQGMKMDAGIKKVVFENGLPYCFLEKDNKKIKMCCLHFQGPTKFYVKYFARGRFNGFDKVLVKIMIFLRDCVSSRLGSRQVAFLKKLLIKFRF